AINHIYRDYSEDTGWPPKDIYRIVLVQTFEQGEQRNVRSRCVSTRPDGRDHSVCRAATTRERPLQSQCQAARMSALWLPGLSGQAVPADAARFGESRRVVSA